VFIVILVGVGLSVNLADETVVAGTPVVVHEEAVVLGQTEAVVTGRRRVAPLGEHFVTGVLEERPFAGVGFVGGAKQDVRVVWHSTQML